MGGPDHGAKKIRLASLPSGLGPAGPKAQQMVRTALTSPGALARSGAWGGPIAVRAQVRDPPLRGQLARRRWRDQG